MPWTHRSSSSLRPQQPPSLHGPQEKEERAQRGCLLACDDVTKGTISHKAFTSPLILTDARFKKTVLFLSCCVSKPLFQYVTVCYSVILYENVDESMDLYNNYLKPYE